MRTQGEGEGEGGGNTQYMGVDEVDWHTYYPDLPCDNHAPQNVEHIDERLLLLLLIANRIRIFSLQVLPISKGIKPARNKTKGMCAGGAIAPTTWQIEAQILPPATSTTGYGRVFTRPSDGLGLAAPGAS